MKILEVLFIIALPFIGFAAAAAAMTAVGQSVERRLAEQEAKDRKGKSE